MIKVEGQREAGKRLFRITKGDEGLFLYFCEWELIVGKIRWKNRTCSPRQYAKRIWHDGHYRGWFKS